MEPIKTFNELISQEHVLYLRFFEVMKELQLSLREISNQSNISYTTWQHFMHRRPIKYHPSTLLGIYKWIEKKEKEIRKQKEKEEHD